MHGKKLLVAGVSALAILSAVGATIAGAQSPTPPAPVESQPSDTDGLQVGDQTSPDDPNDPNEPKEAEEANEAEEPGDENLPGGGHADPEGQDVNHEFEGVE